ncbi:MAG: hypothetical protein K6C69_05415 [Lachnospiraceae bacterium]|nr:hypothetical protein [Lachnospiraceae bacterium]
MKKKLMAVVLMLTMVLSMAACGAKKEAKSAGTQLMENFAAVDVNSINMTMDYDMDGESFGLGMDMLENTDSSVKLDISAKLNMEGVSVKDLTPVTTMYMDLSDGLTYYIDLGQIFDFAENIDPQFGMIASYLGLSKDVVKFNIDDLKRVMTAYGLDTSSLEGLDIAGQLGDEIVIDPAITAKENEVVASVGGKFLDELATKNIDGAVQFDNTTLVLSLNEKNTKLLLEAVASMDVEAYGNELCDGLAAIDNYSTEVVDELRNEFVGLNDTLKNAVENYDSSLGSMTFKVNANINVANKVLVLSGDGSVTEGSDTVNMKFGINSSKVENPEYVVPADTMSLDEVMTALVGLMGSLY